ncbi:FAD-dependent monooxygenase [Saccharopolyspora mangrovi]|uniref:FAD-dependent monooxygenase n=1 Tax=Saccharopolyspora mangrovi TaxID=3082379 RepID=A0ABU6AK44_9PSEU|nr:FAD-dependent monooxygenase [Saccharopolyspora sp. S2-29]MEB3371685.1 FAD-dependent monooxygenase [Saccharopolyspora sp. S2-29]
MTTRNVLVVGAGSAGTATAILLAEGGWAVDVAETRPSVTALGSGITLQGNALRVLDELGAWQRLSGYPFDTLGMRAPDGTLLAEVDDVRTGGPELPATLGSYRPDLARVLTERAAEAGAQLRFGTTVTGLRQDDRGVRVTFADGTTGRYDLVVGADGVRSTTRALLGIDAATRATGMGIWRAFTRRPESITRTELYYGGRCYIAGYCPTGEDGMYAYLVEDARDRSDLSPAEGLAVMRELAAHYGGPWRDVELTDPDAVNYTWFETHLLDPPWHRGRVVLAGDAVHTCPPTIAQGAAQALEDASVLAELLLAADSVDDEVLTAYARRRHPRARTVVDASNRIGQWLLDGERGDVPELLAEVTALLTEPA